MESKNKTHFILCMATFRKSWCNVASYFNQISHYAHKHLGLNSTCFEKEKTMSHNRRQKNKFIKF